MDIIDRVRAFGRYYTTRTGLHARSYLGTSFGFSEARLMHELLEKDVTARELARDLGLDEAYVSRTITSFAQRGWLLRMPDSDARRRLLRLTDAGRTIALDLRNRSRQAVEALLDPLPASRREAVASTLERALALFTGATEVTIRALRPGDVGWVLERHGALYAEEEGYDQGFEAVVVRILAEFLERGDPRERGWIAVRGCGASEERLGCIFVMAEPEVQATCRLRLVLVDPQARGTGLGQRMLDDALEWARAQGYARIVLWTHESHQAAGRLYARNGFVLRSSQPTRAFGQNVIDQTWDRDL